MINFSNISKNTPIGFILRLPLKLIPKQMIVIISQGVLKGYKWVKGSGVNAYWLGTYEKEQQNKFFDNIKTNEVIFDIGANVGFYSLIASKKVGINGKVYAFEPAPQNLYYLKKHFELNNCTNSTIIVGGVSDKKDLIYFNDGNHAATGFLSKEKSNLIVPTFKLDELIDDKIISEPSLMKIDVEGAEFDVLNGSKKALERCHPKIFLSTHNEKVHKECMSLLNSLGYKLEPINNSIIDKATEILATY